MEDRVRIEETYNKEGVCIKRTANGKEIQADTKPSIVIMDDSHEWYNRVSYITKEEFKKFNQ